MGFKILLFILLISEVVLATIHGNLILLNKDLKINKEDIIVLRIFLICVVCSL